MRCIFADTFYWIALLNPRDQAHDLAVSVSKGLGAVRIVTIRQAIARSRIPAQSCSPCRTTTTERPCPVNRARVRPNSYAGTPNSARRRFSRSGCNPSSRATGASRRSYSS